MKIFDYSKDQLPEQCPVCGNKDLWLDKNTAFHDKEYRTYYCRNCKWVSDDYDMGISLSAAMGVKI